MRDPNVYAYVAWPDHATSLSLPRGRATRTFVGNALYHTTSDRLDAVRSMDDNFTTLYRELAVLCGTDDVFTTPADAPLQLQAKHNRQQYPGRLVFWRTTAKPIFDSWVKFKIDQTGNDKGWYAAFGERFLTDWPEYERWATVLAQLIDAAQKMLGHPLQTKPQPLPTTVFQDVGHVIERGGEFIADKAGDVWTLGKVAVYGALAIGGALVLGSLASSLRSGKDPAAPYMALARRSRGRS